MHAFCGRGIGAEGHGQQRESARIASRGKMETRLATAAVPWKWMTKTTSRTTAALHNRLEGRSHRFEERGNDVPRLMLGRVVARGNDLHLGLAAVRAATRAAARAAALAPRKWAKRSPDQTTAKTSSQLRGDGKSLGPSKAASKRTKLHENAVSASHTSLS
eukprot:jgi/Undpi1/4268/HiC_scaffold_17.g07634.m1